MARDGLGERLRPGLAVRGIDGGTIGTIAEVWPDVGVGEAWGSVGSIPVSGSEATDLSEYAFTEAMPGEGDSYFRVTGGDGNLYVPFSAVSEVRDDAAVLAIPADDVPSMQWDVIPDFLNVRSVPDSQAGPTQA